MMYRELLRMNFLEKRKVIRWRMGMGMAIEMDWGKEWRYRNQT